MKKGLTEIVFILDKSGSMAGMEADTIGGFNATISKQKEEPGEAYVSTVVFSSSSRVIHDRVDIKEIEPLTARDYYVGGGTALLDAIGNAIHHIGNVHKYARKEDIPEHTIFLITTDGMENCSREYTSQQVKRLIREREEQFGWEFVFIAANIDAVETADKIGIRPERAANYRQDEMGTRASYRAMSRMMTEMRNDCLSKEHDLQSIYDEEENKND